MEIQTHRMVACWAIFMDGCIMSEALLFSTPWWLGSGLNCTRR